MGKEKPSECIGIVGGNIFYLFLLHHTNLRLI